MATNRTLARHREEHFQHRCWIYSAKRRHGGLFGRGAGSV